MPAGVPFLEAVEVGVFCKKEQFKNELVSVKYLHHMLGCSARSFLSYNFNYFRD